MTIATQELSATNNQVQNILEKQVEVSCRNYLSIDNAEVLGIDINWLINQLIEYLLTLYVQVHLAYIPGLLFYKKDTESSRSCDEFVEVQSSVVKEKFGELTHIITQVKHQLENLGDIIGHLRICGLMFVYILINVINGQRGV